MTPQQIALMLISVPVVMGLGWAIFLIIHFRRQATGAAQGATLSS
jgi:hypothetical protein